MVSTIPGAESYDYTWKETLDTWYAVIKDTPPNYYKSFDEASLTNTFARMVWADTNLVGCGASLFHNSIENDYTRLLIRVCNYAPGGNINGSEIYEKGAPASNCPRHTKPSAVYPSLCECQCQ